MDARIDSLIERGALDEAADAIEEALSGPGAGPALVDVAVRLCLRRGDPAAARARLAELVARFPAVATHPRILAAEADVAFDEGRLADVRVAWLRTLEAARALGDGKSEVVALAGLSVCCHAQGEADRAIHFAEEGLVLARARELPLHEGRLLAYLATFHRADGRLGAAIEAAEASCRIFAAIESSYGHLRAAVLLADLLATAGDERALTTAEEARRLAARGANRRTEFLAALVPARLALEQGRQDAARAAIAAAEPLVEGLRGPAGAAELWLVRGRLGVLARDPAAIREAAERLAGSEAPPHRAWAAWLDHRAGALEGRPGDPGRMRGSAAEAERVGEREVTWRLHAAIADAHLAAAGLSGSAEDGFGAYHHLARAAALIEESAASLGPGLADRYRAAPERRTVLEAARRAAALAGVIRGAPADERREEDRRLALRVLDIDRRRLRGEVSPRAVRAAVLDGLLELTGAHRAFLALPGAAGSLPGRSLEGRDLEAEPPPPSHPAVAQVRAGTPYVAQEAEGGPPGALFAAGAVICVPLRSADGAAGFAYADHPIRPGLFAPTDAELVRAFVEQGVLAIEHAELLARAREDATRLAAQREEIDRLSRQLAETLERREAALADALRRLEEIDPAAPTPRGRLVGTSEPMRRLLRTLDRVRLADAPVVIAGESGTGKELVARIVWEESDRKAGPFLTVNCAAIPGELLESELFGHVQGAFTGASRARPGLFAAADGGTIFLDEIGDTPLPMQAKLLRVLQEGEVRPVGAEQTRRVDVRVIAATHRNLEALVAEGKFRADLYYRLNVIRLEVPPLRERRDDLPALVGTLVHRAMRGKGPPPRVAAEALELLAAYDWPGNVRELDAAVRTALVFAEGGVLEASAFLQKPELARLARAQVVAARNGPASAGPAAPVPAPPGPNLADLERWAIVRALAQAGGNKTAAARALGLGRVTLYRKLRAYGLEGGGER